MSSKAQTREKDYERGLRIADSRKAIGLSQDEFSKHLYRRIFCFILTKPLPT